MSIIDHDQWVESWIRKAETDLTAAERLCSFPDILADVVCFHCQQSVEKALKGFLISKGKEIGKTHDLVLLIEESLVWEPSFRVYLKECAELNNYAVEARYPGPGDTYNEEDARKALESARRIVARVKSILKK
jgi:HEPN domain-containing protein